MANSRKQYLSRWRISNNCIWVLSNYFWTIRLIFLRHLYLPLLEKCCKKSNGMGAKKTKAKQSLFQPYVKNGALLPKVTYLNSLGYDKMIPHRSWQLRCPSSVQWDWWLELSPRYSDRDLPWMCYSRFCPRWSQLITQEGQLPLPLWKRLILYEDW